MPKNTGTPPTAELVDIRFKSGHIVRSKNPKHYRWASWSSLGRPDLDGHEFDIADYQVVKD